MVSWIKAPYRLSSSTNHRLKRKLSTVSPFFSSLRFLSLSLILHSFLRAPNTHTTPQEKNQ
ncbi:hypothetical protein Pint_11543 [Pistacia integerrima]|uniref:Uncharacterized protein n=1 Tax=Pistacia integerrima TaxID=434235 RepID=A0ACC0XHF6_9ROSI|nr:hypothetical protein Pint_11543 [Pistacia integerrima]